MPQSGCQSVATRCGRAGSTVRGVPVKKKRPASTRRASCSRGFGVQSYGQCINGSSQPISAATISRNNS